MIHEMIGNHESELWSSWIIGDRWWWSLWENNRKREQNIGATEYDKGKIENGFKLKRVQTNNCNTPQIWFNFIQRGKKLIVHH